jgi:hypothetical protein
VGDSSGDSDLLEAPEARYATERRRSIEWLKFSTEQLLQLFYVRYSA